MNLIELDKEFSGLIDKYRNKLKDIYITVGDMQSYKQKLWEIVTKSIRYVLAQPEIYTLGQYESALVEQYPEQILNKYEEFLQKSACNTATRKTYRKWVGLLIHMKKIKGGKSCVKKIADSWRSSYNNRPAMMQEIDKL